MRRVVSWPRPARTPDPDGDRDDHPTDVAVAACPACTKQFAPWWNYCIRCGRNLHQPFTVQHKLRHTLRWFGWLPLMRQWPIGYVVDIGEDTDTADAGGACEPAHDGLPVAAPAPPGDGPASAG